MIPSQTQLNNLKTQPHCEVSPQEAFEVWLAIRKERWTHEKLSELIKEKTGRYVSANTLGIWRRSYNWEGRVTLNTTHMINLTELEELKNDASILTPTAVYGLQVLLLRRLAAYLKSDAYNDQEASGMVRVMKEIRDLGDRMAGKPQAVAPATGPQREIVVEANFKPRKTD